MKKISPEITLKIIALSKCFWFWASYYNFYSTILGISARELELKFPRGIYKKYQVTESILNELVETKRLEKIKEIISVFYQLRTPFDKDDNPKYEEAVRELKDFKDIVGHDVIEMEIKEKEFQQKIKKRKKEDVISKEVKAELNTLKNIFIKYSQMTDQKDKQERGFWLEKAFFKVLELEKFDFSNPYRTEYEQIDGHFKFESFDYLVEIKWTHDLVKQRDISVLDGKIKKKAQSNRGCIVAISGFDKSAIDFATRDNPNLIFIDGNEIMQILEQYVTFYDLLKSKEDNLVRFGKVYK